MVEKWCIYWVSLDPVVGSEQSGTRPALVVSNDIVNEVLPIVTILPLSSVKDNSHIYPTEVLLSKEISSLPKESVVMIHQIRTISKERLGRQCGKICDEGIKSNIENVMKSYFDLG